MTSSHYSIPVWGRFFEFLNNLWFQVFEKNSSIKGQAFSLFEKSETKTRRQNVNGNY
jgi:hypothetical protein